MSVSTDKTKSKDYTLLYDFNEPKEPWMTGQSWEKPFCKGCGNNFSHCVCADESDEREF